MRAESTDTEQVDLSEFDVTIAGRPLERLVGWRWRSQVREDEALYAPCEYETTLFVDMVGVRTPLDVAWLSGSLVVAVEHLPAWTGHASHIGDAFVEFAPGAVDLQVGDEVIRP